MKNHKTVSTIVASACVAALSSMSALAAGVMSPGMVATAGETAKESSGIQKTQRRRGRRRGSRRRGRGFRGRGNRRGRGRYRRRGRGGSWVGPAIGAGIASLIIGGAIDASKSRYRSRWERCDDRYRSFRWSDGTFQPYGGGSRKLCPYLRR